MSELVFQSLQGLRDYEATRVLQLEWVEKRIRDEIPDTVLFLEHAPVVSRGRGLQFTGEARARHMPAPILPADISFCESERGGDLTYHGPGQLVIYPIIKIESHDVGKFVRALEAVVIEVLATFGIQGESREGATGVWVGQKKLASLGIAVKRWVSYHGVAINCVNDLAPFQLFSPCGFSPEVMGRVMDCTDVLGANGEPSAQWRSVMEERFKNVSAWDRVSTHLRKPLGASQSR